MAYNKNLNIGPNNVVNISGSLVTLTGSLYGAEVSGTTAQFTTVSASVVSASQYIGLNLTASVISGSELNIDYIDFAPQATEPAYQLGRVFYDGSGSLAAYTDIEDVKINLGQELVLRVHNETGAPINKGKVVRITATTSSTDTPRIVTASWDGDPSSASTLGVVVKNINNTEEGYVILNGILLGINLTGLTSGQILYLSSSGDFTTTKPVQPKHEVRVGQVVRPTSNGTMFVRIQNGYELDEIHDILITSKQDGDLLVYDSGSVLWKNSKTLNGSYTISSASITELISTRLTASNAFISGDIRVNGTASIAQLNTLNQTSLIVGDKYITILSGAADHASLDGSGILWGSGSSGPTVNELGSEAHVRYRNILDKLEIFPGLYVSGSTIISGDLVVSGSIVELSTRKIKTNIESINNQLTTISKLNPVSYTRLDDGRKEYGFISEEVKQIYPEFVVGEGINYPKMVSILVSAVQELTQKIENQQSEIELLKNTRGNL